MLAAEGTPSRLVRATMAALATATLLRTGGKQVHISEDRYSVVALWAQCQGLKVPGIWGANPLMVGTIAPAR